MRDLRRCRMSRKGHADNEKVTAASRPHGQPFRAQHDAPTRRSGRGRRREGGCRVSGRASPCGSDGRASGPRPWAPAGAASGAAESKPIEALLQGYRAASWLCFACSVLSIVVALAKLRSIGIVGGMEGKVEDSTRPSSPSAGVSQPDEHELESVVAPRDSKQAAASGSAANIRR